MSNTVGQRAKFPAYSDLSGQATGNEYARNESKFPKIYNQNSHEPVSPAGFTSNTSTIPKDAKSILGRTLRGDEKKNSEVLQRQLDEAEFNNSKPSGSGIFGCMNVCVPTIKIPKKNATHSMSVRE